MITGLSRALLFLYAETPVHAGSDTGLGALDLPIQREVTTRLPIIKGESLKGALRERFRPPAMDEESWKEMFGAPPPRSGTAAGALLPGKLRVHEAQLVAFPAPSLSGFAWVTSPLVRARLERRVSLVRASGGADSTDSRAGSWESPAGTGEEGPAREEAEDTDSRCLMTDTRTKGSKKLRSASVVLGSYAFTAVGDAGLKKWALALARDALPGLAEHAYFREKLAADLFQVSDEALTAIAWECTTVSARVQLGAEDESGKPTKTVQHGPFYSEYLPAETLLVALLESASPGHLMMLADHLNGQVLQVGGDETIGKGLVWCQIPGPSTTTAEPAERRQP